MLSNSYEKRNGHIKKCIISMILVLICLMCTSNADGETIIGSYPINDIFLAQEQSVTCTATSVAMMLRNYAAINGRDYSEITEQYIMNRGWIQGVGMNWIQSYNDVSTGYKSISSMTYSQKKEYLISMLQQHPEGIVIYDQQRPHAVFLCSYSATYDVFFCGDPAGNGYSGKRINLSASSLNLSYGNTDQAIVSSIDDVCYVASDSNDKNIYALTLVSNGGGVIDTYVPSKYGATAKINLTATPSAGYEFAGWTSSNGGTFANAADAITTFTMPAADTVVTANFRSKTAYSIAVTPAAIDFGTVLEGYAAPAAQTATLTNTGNAAVTLVNQSHINYNMVFSKTTLAPGEQATVSIQPRTGLATGDYSTSLIVEAKENSSVYIPVSFVVKAASVATEWYNLSANNKSATKNDVTDTDHNVYLEGYVKYEPNTLLTGSGCFLSKTKSEVEKATPGNAGNALHVSDPASSFVTSGSGYVDAGAYRYTLVYYTAQATGNFGFGTVLEPGQTYYYRFYSLRTVSGVQEITYSDIHTFTTTGTPLAKQYYLITNSGTGGSVTSMTGYYESGRAINLTATPLQGYRFAGWTSSNGGTFANAASASTTFTMPANDTTVTASFQKQYRLTTSAEVGGTVAALNGYYDSGMIISLSATPSAGYKFVSWTSSNGGSFANASNAVTTFIMPAADTVVTANFEPLSTEWSPIQPSGWPIITATQYSQRTKSTTTSASSTLNGWTLYDTTIGEWGGWSEWSTAPVTANADCEVETRTVPAVTKTVHKYSHYRAYLADLGWRTAPLAYSGWNGTWYYITLDSPLSYLGTFDGYAGYGYYNNYVWFNYTTEQQTVTEAYTQYRYRTRSRTYHFYQWSDWSEWTLMY